MTEQPLSRPSSDASVHLDALCAALIAETGLVAGMRQALLAQRAAIAANDGEAVQASIADIGRVVQGLGEARQRRRHILQLLCGDSMLALDEVEAAIGWPFPEAVREARRVLRREAEGVTRDVSINHRVLRGAVEAGDRFLQELFSSWGTSTPTYSASDGRDDPARPAGVLLNKVA